MNDTILKHIAEVWSHRSWLYPGPDRSNAVALACIAAEFRDALAELGTAPGKATADEQRRVLDERGIEKAYDEFVDEALSCYRR